MTRSTFSTPLFSTHHILILALLILTSAAYEEYSYDTGLKAMFYSAAAYCNQSSVVHWECGAACNNITGIQGEVITFVNRTTDTFGYVGFNGIENEIIVAFKGTRWTDFQNWITNLDYFQAPYEYAEEAQVHLGFKIAFESVADLMVRAVHPFIDEHPTARVLITGHSLGAALATLGALELKRQFGISHPDNHMHLYTFGSPRMGNQAFADYLNTLYGEGTYQRVTHYNDLVPHLPPIPVNFIHGGTEVWYYENSNIDLKYVVCPASPFGQSEDLSCSDSLLFKTGIMAHFMYLTHRINKQCDQK